MDFLGGDEIFDKFLSDTVYRDTQVEESAVSLTAGSIYSLDTKGELDFGGGEYKPAGTSLIEPQLRNSGDDYGWWELNGGTYILELNEKLRLNSGQKAILQPHDHLLSSGASHPTCFLDAATAQIRIPLMVPDKELSIKENARVSTLQLMI